MQDKMQYMVRQRATSQMDHFWIMSVVHNWYRMYIFIHSPLRSALATMLAPMFSMAHKRNRSNPPWEGSIVRLEGRNANCKLPDHNQYIPGVLKCLGVRDKEIDECAESEENQQLRHWQPWWTVYSRTRHFNLLLLFFRCPNLDLQGRCNDHGSLRIALGTSYTLESTSSVT